MKTILYVLLLRVIVWVGKKIGMSSVSFSIHGVKVAKYPWRRTVNTFLNDDGKNIIYFTWHPTPSITLFS